jgi:hypothetical protein
MRHAVAACSDVKIVAVDGMKLFVADSRAKTLFLPHHMFVSKFQSSSEFSVIMLD